MRGILLTGDSVAQLKTFPNSRVHLTVTSPPYDDVRTYVGKWALNLPALGEELYRVTVDGGVCCVVIQDGTRDFAKSLTTARLQVDWCDRVGWRLFECCIYRRQGVPGGWWSKRFRVDHEYVLVFFKGKRPRYFDKSHLLVPTKHAGERASGTKRQSDGTTRVLDWKGPTFGRPRNTDGSMRPPSNNVIGDEKCRGSVWDYSPSNTEGNREKLRHPATFPDALAADLIRCFSQPGDIVLDPMCGSGTTCRMAQAYGRRSIGIDINPEYVALARSLL